MGVYVVSHCNLYGTSDLFWTCSRELLDAEYNNIIKELSEQNIKWQDFIFP